MTDAPFVPFRSGPVGKPSTRPLDEFEELIQRHGQGNVKPKHAMERAGRSPALPTPMVIREPASELIQAFDSFRNRKMTQPTPSASPAALSVPTRPIHSATESTRRVEAGAQHRPEGGATPTARSPGAEAVNPPTPRMFMSRREEELLVPAFVRGGVAEGRRALDLRSLQDTPGAGRALQAPLIPNGPVADTSLLVRVSPIPALARSVTLPSDNFRNSLIRGRSDSVFSNASSTLNPLTLEAIRGSRMPGASLSRQDSFDDALEAERDDESIIVAADTKWHVSDGVDSGNGSPTGFGSLDVEQAASSLSDRLGEVFPEIEPDTDIVDTAEKWKRATSAESRDSGNESPTVLPDSNRAPKAAGVEASPALQGQLARHAARLKGREARDAAAREVASMQRAAATWDSQPAAQVGNRIAPGASFVAELTQRRSPQIAS